MSKKVVRASGPVNLNGCLFESIVSTSKHPSPSWARVANYDSKEKIAEGVTFLSNNKFTSKYANSLSDY